MDSISFSAPIVSAANHCRAENLLAATRGAHRLSRSTNSSRRRLRTVAQYTTTTGLADSIQSRITKCKVCEFMTKKEELHVLKPSTPVGEALRALVEEGQSGFPVIDEEWNLVGIVTDYDLLALASPPGEEEGTSMFPDVHSSWKTFHEVQKLICKTNGRIVSDVMTPAPLTVHETASLGEASRLMLKTKHIRLPIVDADGLLVGIITREDVVRAALQLNTIHKKLP